LVTGAGVRVFLDKADCYVSTNDLTFSGLQAALAKALAIMGLTLPGPRANLAHINLELLRDYATAKATTCFAPMASIARPLASGRATPATLPFSASGTMPPSPTTWPSRRAKCSTPTTSSRAPTR
jgi:hypothetical protein